MAAVLTVGTMGQFIERVALLLLVAAIVALIAQRCRFPYAIGLVIAGLGLKLMSIGPAIELTRDLLFTTLLPPLIFEAAICLPWRTLRTQLPVVLALATLGVVLSAGVTSGAMHALGGWPILPAITFGALIAATDPVSVIATFRELRVHGRLRLLVEAESLFNDGTAAVLFATAVTLGNGGAVNASAIASSVLLSVGGGIASGAGVAIVTRFLAGRTSDHLIEITFSVVVAYGSFLLAEHFGGSGIIATLVAGLVFGARRPRTPGPASDRVTVEAFWEFVAFAANSLIFLLIGLQGAQRVFSGIASTVLLAIFAVTVARATTVYAVAALFHNSSLRVPIVHQHALVWGGLRGALGLALALGLPLAFPVRDDVIAATFSVVAFSIVVQGLSLPGLLRLLRLRTSAPRDLSPDP
jgi:CPA1 family monovalent cation:H+ antiporter